MNSFVIIIIIVILFVLIYKMNHHDENFVYYPTMLNEPYLNFPYITPYTTYTTYCNSCDKSISDCTNCGNCGVCVNGEKAKCIHGNINGPSEDQCDVWNYNDNANTNIVYVDSGVPYYYPFYYDMFYPPYYYNRHSGGVYNYGRKYYRNKNRSNQHKKR